MTKKILCAIDFSDPSRHAMEVAIRLANDARAELVLTHTWYVPPSPIAGEPLFPALTVDLMAKDDERGLALAAEEATRLGAQQVRTVFLTGLPWRQIVDAIEADHDIDLVVMGTHGRTGFARIWLGSVAEKVVRHAPCSVLVTRGAATTFHRILCPIDFSERARDAVAAAALLAERMRAELVLAHVVEVPVTYSGKPPIFELVNDLETRARQTLDSWAADLRDKVTTSVTTRCRIGSPAATVLGLLDAEPDFDLVVTGSHGRTGIARMLLGSVAEQLVRHAPCSVLVSRSRPA